MAHSLGPAFLPIGPVPFLFPMERWHGIAIPLVAWITLAFVLHGRLPAPRWTTTAWRAALIYVAARAGETLAIPPLELGGWARRAAWGTFDLQSLTLLLVFLAAGLATSLPVALALHRRHEKGARFVVVTTILASLAAYLAAAVTGLGVSLAVLG